MIITCPQCKEPHNLEPNEIRRGRRFCSKKCWYAWNCGANNVKSNRVSLKCDGCGKAFDKIPCHVGRLNYCGLKCSSRAHRDKIVGEKHPFWAGGSLVSRGAAWSRIRMEVIVDQGGKCAHCGMTNAEHKAKYKKSLTVHHKILYRLTLSNERENLEALCLPCHRRADVALFKSLTEDEKRIIAERTREYQALGKDIPDFSYQYDLCPECGKKKKKSAKLCQKCAALVRRIGNPNYSCARCGKAKRHRTNRATLCRKCRAKTQIEANPDHICPQCGGFKKTSAAKICLKCSRPGNPRKVCPICGGYKDNPTARMCFKCRHHRPRDDKDQPLLFKID